MFLKSHCGRHHWRPFLCPLTPLPPSWQGRGFVWVLTHSVLREEGECRLIKTYCDSSLPLARGGFRREHATQPRRVRGQLTPWRRASQKDVPPWQTLEDKLPLFAFTHGFLRMWCLELWQPPCDMKLTCWEWWRERSCAMAWLIQLPSELHSRTSYLWARIFLLFKVIFSG